MLHFHSTRSRVALALVATATALLSPSLAEEEVWLSPVSGTWSTGSNWEDGTAPDPAGSPSLILRFATLGAANTVATHDLGNGFLVNRLGFEQKAGSALTLAAFPSKTITLTGVNSAISQNGAGPITINAPLVFDPADNLTTIDGTGVGNVTIASSLTGLGSGKTLRIAMPSGSADGPLVTFSGAHFLTGTVALDSGNVVLAGTSTFGSANVRVNGGTIRFAASNVSLGSTLELGADLIVVDVANTNLFNAISSATPSAGLQLRAGTASETLKLRGASTYTGATVVDFGPTSTVAEPTGATLRLTANSSLLNTSGFDIRTGGNLVIETARVGITDRVADSTPVTLRSGGLIAEVVSNGTSVQSEVVGPVLVAGFASITTRPLGSGVDLIAQSLTRLERGTLVFNSPTLEGQPGFAGRFFFSAPLVLSGGAGSGPNISIVPYAIGTVSSDSGPAGLVTYEPGGGVRMLNPQSEYVSDLASAAPTNNVRLSSFGPTLGADATVNALVIEPSAVSLTGAGTLTVTSGTILATGPAYLGSEISVPLRFGTAEAQIFALGDLTLAQSVSGSGGLTKSGRGTLVFESANSFSGPLTINAGIVSFSAMDQLGTDSGPIVFNGPDPTLRYTGSGSLSLTRPIHAASGFARLEAAQDAVLVVDAPVTGPGGLRTGENFSTPSSEKGVVRLNVPNSHQGPTLIMHGITEFANDAVFGDSDIWLRGTLRLLAPWSTARNLRVTPFGGIINTNGFDATWTGLLTGTGPLQKAGAGTLAIVAPEPFSGGMFLSAGTVTLVGNGAVQSNFLTIRRDAMLHVEATGSSSERLPANAQVWIEGGEWRVTGNNDRPGVVRIASLGASSGAAGSVARFLPSAIHPLTVQLHALPTFGGDLLIRADDLGGASGTAFTRILIEAPNTQAGALMQGVYAAGANETGGERFVTYNAGSDAAGIIGLQPFAVAAYTPTALLQNPATPVEANALIQGAATAGGTSNTVQTLTFDPGASLTQTASQTVHVSGGGIVVRSGGAPAVITGGTLDLGESFATIAAFGDVVVDAAITGTFWSKVGPGLLTLGAQPAGSPWIGVGSGALRPMTASTFANQTVYLNYGEATLDLGGNPASVGTLVGRGTVRPGGATLTLGTAPSDSDFRGSFAGTGQVVVVDGGDPEAFRYIERTGPGEVTVTLASGRLKYSYYGLENPTALTLAGGVLESPQGNVPLIVTGDAVIRGTGFLYGSPAAISGPGNVRLELTGTFTLAAPAIHTGETTVSGRLLNLESPAGALSATSTIRLDEGSLSVRYGSNPANRLNPNAPVHVRGGSFSAAGPFNAQAVHQTPALFAGPRSVLDLTADPSSTTSAIEFRPTRFEREDAGVLKVNAADLVGAAAPRHVAVHIATPPAMSGGAASSGPDTSIIPWVVTYNGFAQSLATYDPVRGLRALDAVVDFAQGTAMVAAPTNNLRVSGVETLSQPLEVNSLVLSDHLAPPSLEGTGALTVRSGLILSASSSNIASPLAFGSNEAIFHTDFGEMTVSGVISGNSGLTKAGSRTLTLSGTNTFTGPLRVIDGRLRYTRTEALGPDSSPVQLDGGSLVYVGANPATLARPITLLRGGGGVHSDNAGAVLTIAGTIDGNGGITFRGGEMLLAGSNSYTGDTTLETGILRFNSGAALGQGALRLFGGVLEPASDWTRAGMVYVSGQDSTISSGPFNVTISGRVVGDGTLNKRGSGRLTVTDATRFTGGIKVWEGDLEFYGPSTFGSSVSVAAGARFSGLGNVARFIASNGTLAPGPGVGTLTALGTTFNAGGALALEIASATSFDQLVVNSLSLGAPTNLMIELTYDPSDGIDSFAIVRNAGADPVFGHFYFAATELNEGATFLVGSQEMRVSYIGGDGNDVLLYAVPELSSAAFLLGALGWFGGSRRRSEVQLPCENASGIFPKGMSYRLKGGTPNLTPAKRGQSPCCQRCVSIPGRARPMVIEPCPSAPIWVCVRIPVPR